MAAESAIEWTTATWNPVTGCTRVSLGCRHCYAERMAKRLKAMGQPNYANGFTVTVHRHMLSLPERWPRPRIIFVNSMGDLFHEAVPERFIRDVFDVMVRADRHIYQVLTKRSQRLCDLAARLPRAPNIWVGVTVEHESCLSRIDDLRHTRAATKFLSCEPLLGPLPGLDLDGIDWVIVGGESGPGARPMRREWVLDVRDQCRRANVAFFFKQWGGTRKKRAGRMLDGRTYDEMPAPAGRWAFSRVAARWPRPR